MEVAVLGRQNRGQSLSCGGAREIITTDVAERHKGNVRKHSEWVGQWIEPPSEYR